MSFRTLNVRSQEWIHLSLQFKLISIPLPVDTIQELNNTIQSAVQSMRKTEQPITAVVSACELFSRFITLARFDDKTMDECRTILVNRGEIFLNKLMQARPIIAKQAAQFITDDCVSN